MSSDIENLENDDQTSELMEKWEVIRGDLKFECIIKSSLCGYIVEIDKNSAKSILNTNMDMKIDNENLIDVSFLFMAANYCAYAAINEKYLVTIGVKISFLAHPKLGDVIDFVATSNFEESKKREVRVVGTIKDIKIFDAVYQILILEDHVLRMKEKLTKKATKNKDKED
ncbi:MAG: PaaI family thioesterase [Campylobacter sputorum]|uniref:hypothetical protein n=1 Tax=Campylobacter sputorum TaxID=206 RepID=UPI000B7771CE|nr:hypothetical protein [Campylobacter sputorum]ASM38387.1 acyl-CoA thioesterase [Campylobacter sputorum bv. paraureolyticus LMG 11764]MDY6119822.1 PaaI family thioesterase [Campylobacter sputorum]